MTRREALSLALAAPLRSAGVDSRICLFTDHLSGFAYPDLARMLRQLGVAGPDLTVRNGGLVLPERVTHDIPAVARALTGQGLTIPMITTNVTSADDALTRPLLTAARQAGVRYYKLGYYPYKDLALWEQTIAATRRQMQGLAKLNRELGIRAGLHNHAGHSVGGASWDGWEVLQGVDAQDVGVFFDPSHATIEGGKVGWNLALRRASSRIFMVAVKDFIWEKSVKGWTTRWVPLGQGMVQWPEFFQILKTVPFPGPLSLHIEYDPGGKTQSERYDKALHAAEQDLSFLRSQLRAAGM